jgi:hypothetical protein
MGTGMMWAPDFMSIAVRRGADCGRDDEDAAADAEAGRRCPDAAISPRDWAKEGLRDSGVWLSATGTSGCASFRRETLFFLSWEAIMAGETNEEGNVDKFIGGLSTTVAALVVLLLVDVADREILRDPSALRLGVTGREEPGVLNDVGVCDREDPPVVATATGWCEFGGWAGIALVTAAVCLCCAVYACTRASTVSASGFRKLRAN